MISDKHTISARRPLGACFYGKTTQTVMLSISGLEEKKNHLVNAYKEMPLYSTKVQAGFPSPADPYIESYLDLNEHLIQHPASTFFLIAAGDSMQGASIEPGDLLIVDKSLEPSHGKIVIAALDRELTVKRLSKSVDKIQLLPAHPAFKPIDITSSQDFVIWGVVTHVIYKAT